jgi:hypothetical protein
MFVACSEGGSLEDNTLSENIPIELGAYASKYSDTRAGGTIGNNDLASIAQNGGFGVYSYFMHTQEFMNNQQVTAVTRDIEGGGKEIVGWTYSPMKYWPNNPSSTLDFFAYAPYARPAANETSGIISVDDANHIPIPIVSYQLDQYGKNVDLMWGTNGDTSGAKNVFTDMAKPSVNQKVEFKFKHTLAKIGGAALNGNDTGGLTIQLDVDNNGNITGGMTGTYEVKEGTNFITIKSGDTTFKGIMVEMKDEAGNNTFCISAVGDNNHSIWGVRYGKTSDQ